MALISKNPANGEIMATFEELNSKEIEKRLVLADAAFHRWKNTSFAERSSLMKKAAELLRKNAYTYATHMTKEMGKPIKQAMAEVEKCAWVCDFYADKAEEFLKPEVVETDASESYVRFDPLGIVLAVMPWNFPFWQVIRFTAPTLMAGNVGLLKHASNVPQCAIAIEEVFTQAGFPKGVFQTLLIGSSKVAALVQDPRVKAATLTGSEYAGSQLAMHCGEQLKKTVLELGGSDPFIVLADADLDVAASTATLARLQNNGQSCIAAKRFIVVQEIAEKFIEKIKPLFEAMKIGDPIDESTQIGPLADVRFRDDVHEQVKRSVALGATLITGGVVPEGPGAFYPPTLLSNVKKGMPAYHEELFGPAASVITVKNEQEAIEVANDIPFGLGSSIWTKDIDKARKLASKIDAGAVFINAMVRSDPRLPFGGIKRSGYGRELGTYGLREFVNVKTVCVK